MIFGQRTVTDQITFYVSIFRLLIVLVSLFHKLENCSLNKFKDVLQLYNYMKNQGNIILKISKNVSEILEIYHLYLIKLNSI